MTLFLLPGGWPSVETGNVVMKVEQYFSVGSEGWSSLLGGGQVSEVLERLRKIRMKSVQMNTTW